MSLQRSVTSRRIEALGDFTGRDAPNRTDQGPAATPPEHAIAAAAAAMVEAERRRAEARAELATLLQDHEHSVGLSRAAVLTGLSRTTLLRLRSDRYAHTQSLR